MVVGKTYIAGGIYEEEKDTTLYAQWGATEYELIYNANGGTVEKASKPVVYNEIYGSLPVPTKEGYKFIGWYTEISGGTKIAETMKYKIAGNQTIYARWEIEWVLATTSITATNYGDGVNYSANGITNWKIFLKDGGRIYIIAGDYVLNSGLNKASGISNGDGSYCVKGSNAIVLLNWLKNTSYWTAYANGFSGATATGGPTFAQLVRSLNQKLGKSYSEDDSRDNAGITGITDLLYNPHPGNDNWNSCKIYWLASNYTYNSTTIWDFDCGGCGVWDHEYYKNDASVRPLVCLPSGIYAKKENDGRWSFKK